MSRLLIFLSGMAVSPLLQRATAQNLVPNPDFEGYDTCPLGNSNLNDISDWFSPHPSIAGAGTPDYYNACATAASTMSVPVNWGGTQQARSGGGYGGIFLWESYFSQAREFIEVELLSELEAGTCYHFEMHLNCCDICRYTTDDIGAYLSPTEIANNSDFYQFQPQFVNVQDNMPDSAGWTLVSGDITAEGGERYLLLGNFLNDANTTLVAYAPDAYFQVVYTYIDDVSLTPCVSTGNTISAQGTGVPVVSAFGNRLRVELPSQARCTLFLHDANGRLLLDRSVAGSTELDVTGIAAGPVSFTLVGSAGLIRHGRLVVLGAND